MFNTTPKMITDYLSGMHLDLSEATRYSHFEQGDIMNLDLDEKMISKGIDDISFKNINLRCVPFIMPTISPGRVSAKPDYLEHPQEIFNEYIEQGVTKIIGEVKHMGSNATIYVFKDVATAKEYTGQEKTCYIITRNGYNFFSNPSVEKEVVTRLEKILKDVNYFDLFGFKFAVWNAEILPWNYKATSLLTKEYMPAYELANNLYGSINKELLNRELPVRKEFRKYIDKTLENIESYHQQLKNYCHKVESVKDIKIAPFRLLATDSTTFYDDTHKAQLEHFNRIIYAPTNHDNLLIPTEYKEVDLTSQRSMDEAIEWWGHLTAHGHEGAIFKTWFVTQPGAIPMLKCRGKEYLRLIYGINYDMPDQLAKHKRRSTSRKRKLHKVENLLNIISLNRFIRKQDNHDYVMALLALSKCDITDIRL